MRYAVIAALIVAASLLSFPAVAAEPTVQGSAEGALWSCAEFWDAKTTEELDNAVGRAKTALLGARTILQKRLDAYPDQIKAAEAEVDQLERRWDSALLKAIEDVMKTGLELSLDNADEIAAALKSDSDADDILIALRKADARLEQLKKDYARDKAAMASLGAQDAALQVCADDQRAYLGKAAPTTGTTQTPTTGSSRQMVGQWSIKCGDDESGGFEVNGQFIFDFTIARENEKEGVVSGSLLIGTDVIPVNGQWLREQGIVIASAKPAGSPSPWLFNGTVVENTGQLVSTGSVTGNLDSGTLCKGAYNGQEQ
jgi:hypothetical protein